jgi:hypothetical protein
MKYGQIAGNRRINEFIYFCFQYISEEDKRKFVKKFRHQPKESVEIMHTFRELILGAYLCSLCKRAKYECIVSNRTPDWSIFDIDSNLCAIVELTNFHLDHVTEREVEEQSRCRGIANIWRDAHKNNRNRLYQAILNKAGQYKSLIQEMQLPYVIAVFGEFYATIDFEEVCYCLNDKESGLFNMYPELSGVLYLEERHGSYFFNYENNPSALRRFDLPNTDSFHLDAG